MGFYLHVWCRYRSLALFLHPHWSLWSWCMKVTGKTRFGTSLQKWVRRSEINEFRTWAESQYPFLPPFPLVYTNRVWQRQHSSPLWNGTPLDSRYHQRCWPLDSCYVGRSDKSQTVNVLSSATVSMVLVFWFWSVHDKSFMKWTTLWRSAFALGFAFAEFAIISCGKGTETSQGGVGSH